MLYGGEHRRDYAAEDGHDLFGRRAAHGPCEGILAERNLTQYTACNQKVGVRVSVPGELSQEELGAECEGRLERTDAGPRESLRPQREQEEGRNKSGENVADD